MKLSKSILLTHPINAQIGKEACVAVQNTIKANDSYRMLWKSEKESLVLLSVGCLQV